MREQMSNPVFNQDVIPFPGVVRERRHFIATILAALRGRPHMQMRSPKKDNPARPTNLPKGSVSPLY
ncbi:MAG: hypothetical protein AAFR13_02120 [Pseudomonadota bacterium]